MTPTPQQPDVRELAIAAIWCDGLGPVMSPEDLADAVLAAVTPVIRRQVAEEIADRIAPLIDSAIGDDTHNAYVNAAAIVRSHSTEQS